MQRTRFKYFSLFAVAALAAASLAGCGASIQDSEPSSGVSAETDEQRDDQGTDTGTNGDAAPSTGEAVLSYGDTVYTAKLQFCSLQGGEDALFHGAAYDDSGESVGYLDGDFGDLSDLPYGEVRINFGATAQFESTDKQVTMGGSDDLVVTDHSATSLIMVGGAWDQDGTQLPTATLRVKC